MAGWIAHSPMNIIILDDYQDAVRKLRCAAKLDGLSAKVYTNTVKGIGQLAVRLRDAEALVAIRERKASKKLAEGNLEFPGLANVPPHLEFDKAKMSAKVNGKIEREWVALEINELLVVEFYSRKV